MAKRSNGEGTIFKRNDGKWCGSKYIELEDGTKKRKYVYGKTQKSVKERLKELEGYKEKANKEITLQEWMMEWLEQYKKQVLKQTTYESYRSNIEVHIVGSRLGGTELSKVTTELLQRFYNDKLKGASGRKALSRRTVEYLHTIVGSALSQAYKNDMIPKNVNDYTVLPKKEVQEIVPLTLEEVHRLLMKAEESEMFALIVVEMYTGLRKGEILGLQWKNIDFVKKQLYVRKSLCRVRDTEDNAKKKTKLVLLEPKTKKSSRTIPLTQEAIRVLKLHKKKQNEEKMKYRDVYQDNGMVFAKRDGSFEDPRGVLRRFHKILADAGIRECRFHDLRHTFASLLLNEGESMKVIQELLGHSTITTTMDIYSHVADYTKEKAVANLEDLVKIS